MTTHEKAQIEFHRVAEVTKEGSVLNLDAAVSAYLSALTPPDMAGLVDMRRGDLMPAISSWATDVDISLTIGDADNLAARIISTLTHLSSENALLREREGWKLVPVEPTGEMMDAARHLFQWLAFSRPTESALMEHCSRRRLEAPAECRDIDHVPPKRMMAFWIFKAMLTASPSHKEQNNG